MSIDMISHFYMCRSFQMGVKLCYSNLTRRCDYHWPRQRLPVPLTGSWHTWQHTPAPDFLYNNWSERDNFMPLWKKPSHLCALTKRKGGVGTRAAFISILFPNYIVSIFIPFLNSHIALTLWHVLEKKLSMKFCFWQEPTQSLHFSHKIHAKG